KSDHRPGADGQRRKRGDNDGAANSQQHNDGKLPGDYPPSEDIMSRRDMLRVSFDVENFSRSLGPEYYQKQGPTMNQRDEMSEKPAPQNLSLEEIWDEMDITEADVTEEDLKALGPEDLSMDLGDDESLKNRVWPVDMAGEDLDVPGAELDDLNELIGSEDEENNPYSLGGDRHEDLEDDPTAPSQPPL
ncbi:MAG: hypothetical protein ACOYXT_01005, partial [Bacteroidota bacterium]